MSKTHGILFPCIRPTGEGAVGSYVLQSCSHLLKTVLRYSKWIGLCWWQGGGGNKTQKRIQGSQPHITTSPVRTGHSFQSQHFPSLSGLGEQKRVYQEFTNQTRIKLIFFFLTSNYTGPNMDYKKSFISFVQAGGWLRVQFERPFHYITKYDSTSKGAYMMQAKPFWRGRLFLLDFLTSFWGQQHSWIASIWKSKHGIFFLKCFI